jgi:hypothetical protein
MTRVGGCLLVLWMAGVAAADPAPMSAGGQPTPSTSGTVRLAREELTIDVDLKAAAVRALLFLENAGAAQALTLGFPCGDAALSCRAKVTVTLDGKRASVRRKGKYFLWPMKIAAGGKVAVEVRYRSPLVNGRYETPYYGMGALTYKLTTGAAWAGPIGELIMTVRVPTNAVLYVNPAGAVRTSGTVSWNLKDVEPQGDLALFFDGRLLNMRGETPAQRAELARELRENLKEHVEWTDLLHRITGKTMTLPAPTEEGVRATTEESAKLVEATP